MDAQGPYTAHWHEYNKQLGFFWLAFLAPIPGMVFLFELASWLGSDLPPIIGAVAWQLVFLLAGVRLMLFTCPRCGHCFCQFGNGVAFFCASHCSYCDLPFGAPHDPGTHRHGPSGERG